MSSQKYHIKIFDRKSVLFAIFISVTVCAAYIFYVNSKPLYTLSTKVTFSESVLPKPSAYNLKGMDRSVRRLIRRNIKLNRSQSLLRIEEKIVILKSHTFLSSYISERNLKPKLFYKKWDPVEKKWIKKKKNMIAKVRSLFKSNRDRPRKGKRSGEPSDYLAVKMLKAKIKTKKDITSGLLTIKLKWHDSTEGAELLNDLVVYANEYFTEKNRKEINRKISNFKGQLSTARTSKMKKIIFRVIETLEVDKKLKSKGFDNTFSVVSEAWPVQKKTIRIPKRKTVIVLVFSFIFTLILIIFYRLGVYKGAEQSPKFTSSNELNNQGA